MLASGASDATIRLWQLGIPSIGQIQVLGKFIIRDHNDDVQRLAWSSQGVLASGSATGVVLTHRVRHEGEDLEAQLVSTLDSKTGGELWGLSWKPDGTQVATANSDSTVRVWRHDGDGIGHRTWRVTEACTTLKWIDSQPERLACAREKSHPDIPSLHYNHFIQFILINFEDQLRLFERLTYGKLDGSDVAALGYQEVEDIVLGDP